MRTLSDKTLSSRFADKGADVTDPNKRLMISAVALVTGNSVVDDLWLKYFPELEDDTEIARDIIITAHLHAVMGRMLPMTDFVRYIEKETKWAESTIKACIGRLRKSNLLRREIGEDSRSPSRRFRSRS
jgi:hypothetical protein